jgi:hypothetical protein
MVSDYEVYVDDTMPLPADVEREFLDKGTDQVSALAWLDELEIDPGPILETAGCIAAVQWTLIWDCHSERYRFHIYEPEHVGPKYPLHIAVPIVEDGAFVDLLLMDADCVDDYTRSCGQAQWLGREQLLQPVVRLHRDPFNWLEAGCRGVCHIEPISRKALKDLGQAGKIQCSDIHTALEAWDWGFAADDDELARFVIDAHPENIRAYFDDLARWSAVHALQQTDLWPRAAWRAR